MDAVKAGDKVYAKSDGEVHRVVPCGKRTVGTGMNILGARNRFPCLDLKQNPLYEDSGFADLIPILRRDQEIPVGDDPAWHPRVRSCAKDGTKEVVSIGEKGRGSVFAVTDLLCIYPPKQMEKKASRSRGG